MVDFIKVFFYIFFNYVINGWKFKVFIASYRMPFLVIE